MPADEEGIDMDKDFLTYNQQMKHLRNDKHISCKGTTDKKVLCRYGYFNLVNGYKDPFVTGRDSNGNHKYYSGTNIQHLNAVKDFDDTLRMFLLKFIVRAEEEVRTFSAYKFDEINQRGKISWFEVNAFDPEAEIKKVIALISKAYTEISKSQADYVRFYMDQHKVIPTWILVKVINFSTFIDFVDNSKPKVKNAICKLYSIKDGRGYYDYRLLIGSLHWMRQVRNSCAHNERIYTLSRKNKRIAGTYFKRLPESYQRDRTQTIFDLLIYLKYYLSKEDYIELINGVDRMMRELQATIPDSAFEYVRSKMGIKDLSHFSTLLSDAKEIEYNKFEQM